MKTALKLLTIVASLLALILTARADVTIDPSFDPGTGANGLV